jgi:hypothetical protein
MADLNRLTEVDKLVQAVMTLTCSWKISGSNLDKDTDYLVCSFLLSSSVSPGKYWATHLPSKSLPFRYTMNIMTWDTIRMWPKSQLTD